MRITSFGADRRFIESVTGWESVEIAIGEDGPDTATVVLPSTSEHLHYTRVFPDGVGVFYEIDARDLGVPDVFLGRVVRYPWEATGDPDGAEMPVQLPIEGPRAWLEKIAIPAMQQTSARTGNIVRGLVNGLPGTGLVMGRAESKKGGAVEMRGDRFYSFVKGLTEDRGEVAYYTPLPGEAKCQIDILTVGRDMSRDVFLTPGVNCKMSGDADLNRQAEELVMVASSFATPGRSQAVTSRAPAAARFGRKARLDAVLTTAYAQDLLRGGSGPVLVRPDLPSRAALANATETALRRELGPVLGFSAEITDTALWGLKPMDLVGVRHPGDSSGIWRRAIAQVQAVSYSLDPVLACDIVGELWETLS